MSLELTQSERDFRAEARSWLADNAPGRLPPLDSAEGFAARRQWEKRLAEARWSVVAWPEEFGGRGASLTEWVLFEEEYYLSGAPVRVSQNGISLLAPILFNHGTDEQRERLLPAMSDGTTIWAQAWSEPESGSDLASLRSKARRDDDRGGWWLNGQKTWSSRAPFGDWGFGLFRTDPDSQRHHGLTYFLFPLNTAGITVRPIEQLDGDAGFAEIFFDDVFVPDRDVLGSPGEGWRVAMSTAGNERGLSLRSPGRFLNTADRLVELWRKRGGDAPAAADGVVDTWIAAEAYRLYTWSVVGQVESGEDLGPAGSVNKIFWSELDIRAHETALELLGADAELVDDASEDGGAWPLGYLFALSGPIYAGTNEIQRNIIAERILGLPRGSR